MGSSNNVSPLVKFDLLNVLRAIVVTKLLFYETPMAISPVAAIAAAADTTPDENN